MDHTAASRQIDTKAYCRHPLITVLLLAGCDLSHGAHTHAVVCIVGRNLSRHLGLHTTHHEV